MHNLSMGLALALSFAAATIGVRLSLPRPPAGPQVHDVGNCSVGGELPERASNRRDAEAVPRGQASVAPR